MNQLNKKNVKQLQKNKTGKKINYNFKAVDYLDFSHFIIIIIFKNYVTYKYWLIILPALPLKPFQINGKTFYSKYR